MSSIAVIGIGRMGLPICTRLVGAGFDVLASDVDPAREREALEAGARWAPAAAAAAAAAEVVLTVLPGGRELADAAALIVPQLRAHATWIDMTSASPAVAAAWVSRAADRGTWCLDAPIAGGVDAAAAGTLAIFVGGTAVALARHRELLGVLGTVEHMGANGAGYTTKLLVNLLWFGQAIATAEALLLARRCGLDLAALRDTLTRTAAASEFIRHDAPALLAGDYLAAFGVDRCRDQLDAVSELAAAHGVPFAVASEVRDVFAAAVERFGPVDGELLPVALLEERAGVRLSDSTSASDGAASV